ncbi:hypothetical protein [Dankookia sp. P2]|uniref:hypothetical protein n=1 Tax=Dankookia sp. P2 TaxID=3423955 RepID=UPI003D66EA2E
MLLAPHYLTALGALAGLALADERIGCVAAYGDHRAGAGSDPARLIPMEHNWGFALTRRHWLERQPLLLAYRRLLAGVDYRDRPHRRIHEFFWSHGYGIEATSQDGAKHLAALVLGRLRLRCVPCYGHYVGQQGLHWSPAFYAASGHAETRLCLTPPPRFEMPSDQRMGELLEGNETRCADGWRPCCWKTRPGAARLRRNCRWPPKTWSGCCTWVSWRASRTPRATATTSMP